MADAADQYADFDPREYLRQYYSLPQLAADDADLFRALTGWLRRVGRTFDSVLDFGCGPTLHNTFAVAPYARRVTLADYLPGNREEARRWLADEPGAHDWDPLFRGVLRVEGTDAAALDARKAEYRRKVTAIRPCDLRQPDPLGEPATFDLVTSFFCTECVASSRAEWEAMFARVLGLVAPGGAAFVAVLGGCDRYAVLGRWFDTVRLSERDIAAALAAAGFDPATIEAEAVPAPDWVDDGFDHICLVRGVRP